MINFRVELLYDRVGGGELKLLKWSGVEHPLTDEAILVYRVGSDLACDRLLAFSEFPSACASDDISPRDPNRML